MLKKQYDLPLGEELRLAGDISITILGVRGQTVRLEVHSPGTPHVVWPDPDDESLALVRDDELAADESDDLSESRFFPEFA